MTAIRVKAGAAAARAASGKASSLPAVRIKPAAGVLKAALQPSPGAGRKPAVALRKPGAAKPGAAGAAAANAGAAAKPGPGPDPAHYELLEAIGRGGTGTVFRARDKFLDFDVAVKIVDRDLLADPEVLAAFKDEARITMQLSHPNILRLYSFQSHEGCPYVVMELVRGESLRAALESRGALAVRTVCQIVRQCASALGFAHAHNVVHKDVKPENVFIAETGELKVIDFGSAVLNGARANASGAIVGTPEYMAPEQLRGDIVGPGADIYALAVMAHLALVGVFPYPAGTTPAQLLSGAVRPGFAALPEVLVPIFEKATAPDPAARHATAAEFARDLAWACGCPDVFDDPDEPIRLDPAVRQ